MPQGRYTKRIAAAAGSLAGLSAAPLVSEAALIHVTGSPVSLSTSAANGTSVTWDIDGDSVGEFRLWARANAGTRYSYAYRSAMMFLASNTVGGGQGNGRGLVAPGFTDNVQALGRSFNVGPSASFGNANSGYDTARIAMRSLVNPYVNFKGIGDAFYFDDFHEGDNAVGFAFDDGTGVRYGFAIFNFDTTTGTVTISEWTYNDEVGVPVHVTADLLAVPEPGSLALLALGAAGLLAYRARRTPSKPADEIPAG